MSLKRSGTRRMKDWKEKISEVWVANQVKSPPEMIEKLHEAVETILTQEREECANIAEKKEIKMAKITDKYCSCSIRVGPYSSAIAKAIRARGEG